MSNNKYFPESDISIIEERLLTISNFESRLNNKGSIKDAIFDNSKNSYFEEIMGQFEYDIALEKIGRTPNRKYSIYYFGSFDYTTYWALLKTTSFRHTFNRDLFFWPLVASSLIAYLALTKSLLFFCFIFLIPIGFFTSAFSFFGVVIMISLLYSLYQWYLGDISWLLINLSWATSHSCMLNLKIDYKNYIENLCKRSELCLRFFNDYLNNVEIIEN